MVVPASDEFVCEFRHCVLFEVLVVGVDDGFEYVLVDGGESGVEGVAEMSVDVPVGEGGACAAPEGYCEWQFVVYLKTALHCYCYYYCYYYCNSFNSYIVNVLINVQRCK